MVKDANTRFVVVMGVAGSGKTTVGRALATALGWDFHDADDYHSPQNVAKMAKGVPLDDADRMSWLATLNRMVLSDIEAGRSCVVACSALKESYRSTLVEGGGDAFIVYLKGECGLIAERMAARPDHYMGPRMLASQFEDLEEPEEALVVDISRPVEEIVRQIIERM